MIPVTATLAGSTPATSAAASKGLATDVDFDGLLDTLGADQGGKNEATSAGGSGQGQVSTQRRRTAADSIGIADVIAATAAALAAAASRPAPSASPPNALPSIGAAGPDSPRTDGSDGLILPAASKPSGPAAVPAAAGASPVAVCSTARPQPAPSASPPSADARADRSNIGSGTRTHAAPADGPDHRTGSDAQPRRTGRPDSEAPPVPPGLPSPAGPLDASPTAVVSATPGDNGAAPDTPATPAPQIAAAPTRLPVPGPPATPARAGNPFGPSDSATGSSSAIAAPAVKPRDDTAVVKADNGTDTITPPTPVGQVVAALRTLGLDATAPPAPPASEPDAASTRATAPVATKTQASGTLAITLSPDHLGRVAITMQRRGDRIEIRIKVASPEALRLLEQDRHILAAVVDAAKHDVILQPSQPMPADTPGWLPTGDAPSQGAFAATASAGDGRSRHDRHPDPTPTAATPGDDDTSPLTNASDPRRDGSLYV